MSVTKKRKRKLLKLNLNLQSMRSRKRETSITRDLIISIEGLLRMKLTKLLMGMKGLSIEGSQLISITIKCSQNLPQSRQHLVSKGPSLSIQPNSDNSETTRKKMELKIVEKKMKKGLRQILKSQFSLKLFSRNQKTICPLN